MTSIKVGEVFLFTEDCKFIACEANELFIAFRLTEQWLYAFSFTEKANVAIDLSMLSWYEDRAKIISSVDYRVLPVIGTDKHVKDVFDILHSIERNEYEQMLYEHHSNILMKRAAE